MSFTVTVGVGAGGADGATPLVNVAAPSTPGGSCAVAADCTTSHLVQRLFVAVTPVCASDAASVSYDLSPVNVPNASSLTMTATWRTQDGTVVRVDTIPAGQLTGTLLWPGIVLNAQGIAVGWPGWRDLQPSDFPLAPGARIYGTQIEDTTLPSYAYRLPMTVTFEINPTAVVDVSYPDVTPAGCAVPRDPALTISKTASTASITPGTPFTYDISVTNTSTLGVAYPVTLSDPIPAGLRITGIATSDSAPPRWINCAVTGTDSAGFGGTLNCQLNGALGVSSTAPLITLTAVTSATSGAGTIVNTATVCWLNPSNTSQAQQCTPSSVSVTLPDSGSGGPPPNPGGQLPPTGSQITVTLSVAAAALRSGLVAAGRSAPASSPGVT